jgi:hypothetical protein
MKDGQRMLTNQSITVWALESKSLLSSFYKREEFPLFGKEGSGEIFGRKCLISSESYANL